MERVGRGMNIILAMFSRNDNVLGITNTLKSMGHKATTILAKIGKKAQKKALLQKDKRPCRSDDD